MNDEQGRVARLYEATIGKKAVMAASGVILLLYVFAHMLGNLQVYLGRARLNAYAAALHWSAGVLWSARVVLLAALGVHILAALQLWVTARMARPIAYQKKGNVQATISSRTMIYTGAAILCFVVFHVLNLTVGVAVPGYVELDAYDNVVNAFQQPWASAAYIAGMLLLAPHLRHGLYSFTQSLGLSDPRTTRCIDRLAMTLTVLVIAGFISIPVCVMTGLVE